LEWIGFVIAALKAGVALASAATAAAISVWVAKELSFTPLFIFTRN